MSGGEQKSLHLGFALTGREGAVGPSVQNLKLDSRQVQPGDAFFAVSGRTTHGLQHAKAAIARGAAVVVYDPADGKLSDSPTQVQQIEVSGLATQLGEIADRAYGQPSAALEVVGITGTNGKTTCAWLFALCRDDHAAYLGTIGAGRPPELQSTTHTTGDVFFVHRTLAEFRTAGAVHAAIEVSSHALDQNRVASVRMPIVGFTNLSRDHLDYHGTMTEYAAAKERIFSCRDVRIAVINIDDAAGHEMALRLPKGVAPLSVSLRNSNLSDGLFVCASHVECRENGLLLRGRSHAGDFVLDTRLVGLFNAENLLIVLGLLLASGLPIADACTRLSAATPPPGRMEAFATTGPLVVVDYAHTPDALDKALTALRDHTKGKLYCIFGCGGDRDPGKRPVMAQVAEARADHVVVTDDNPRGENPDNIISMIMGGFSSQNAVRVERNREEAIRSTAALARVGDIVLVAGKGHENYQIYGTEIRQFSDREIARTLTRRAA